MSSAITQPPVAPQKPRALEVRFDTIPVELHPRRQWVGWSYVLKNGKWTKIPVQVRSRRAASSTDPASWDTFDAASEAYRRGGLDGIGLALDGKPDAHGRFLVGLDFDDVVEGGKLRAPFDAIIRELGTYWELSPSGTGVRAFGFGPNVGGVVGTIDGCGVEIYTAGRYLTVTGHG